MENLSGMSLSTMSCGSNRLGIPSSSSATVKARLLLWRMFSALRDVKSMRVGLKWWMMAQNARPSLQEEDMSRMFTESYEEVTLLHQICNARTPLRSTGILYVCLSSFSFYIFSLILCCTLLCFTVLYYTLQYFTILYFNVLHWTILHFTIMYRIELFFLVLLYSVLWGSLLYYTLL